MVQDELRNNSHWQIQGWHRWHVLPLSPAPQLDPILSFLHTFLPKSARVGGWRLPQWLSAPPIGNPGSATGSAGIIHNELTMRQED